MKSELRKSLALLAGISLLGIVATVLILTTVADISGFTTATTTVDVVAVVSITLTNNTVNFGVLVLGSSNNTTNENPPPFTIQNNGNVNEDIDIRASNFLFNSSDAGSNTNFFQFRAGNCSVTACGATDTDAFNWAGSITTFTNFTNVNQKIINSLNSTNTSDDAEIEIKITVPNQEAQVEE